mmetsp:Transcript_4443/g.3672  ORF Transcript_4443/g.3672 Transcript_4443/m.3672 type:complete len:98 (-) Transcript_4443:562-855(-)
MVFHFGDKELELKSTGGALSYLSENFNADPILDLEIAEECQNNWERLKLGQWPGSKRGCNCPLNVVQKLSVAYCTISEDITCTDVDENEPVDYYYWS